MVLTAYRESARSKKAANTNTVVRTRACHVNFEITNERMSFERTNESIEWINLLSTIEEFF